MKEQLIRLLNKELLNAQDELQRAAVNLDLVSRLAWMKYEKLVKNLIKTIQDKG
jgi:hypothetical protein